MKFTKSWPFIQLWRQVDAVCFDYDSTIVKDESIDQMAALVGKGPEVAAVTNMAMSGQLLFEDALEARLKTINMPMSLVEKLGHNKSQRLSDGVEDLIGILQQRNVDIYIVSGGFEQIILPVAQYLKIPQNRIYANYLMFDDKGNYVGFDKFRPTARQGGKRDLVEKLKNQHGYKCLAFIGDGVTDLETYNPPHATDVFIAYCGNISRDVVRNGSSLAVDSFGQLIEWLKIA